MFNIAEFRAKVDKMGVLESSNLVVEIAFPAASGLNTFATTFSNVVQNIRFMAEATNLPGASLMTTEIRRHGYGVVEKKPYVPLFTDLNIVFRSDKEGQLYTLFQTWMKMIINFDARGSINSVTGVLPGQSLYEVAYKENYMATIILHVMDNRGREPLSLILLEAYPIFLGEIPMSWGAVNDYMKIPVKFTFKDWYIENRPIVDQQNLQQQFRGAPQFGPPITQ